MYSHSFPLMLTFIPKHENFKADAADLEIDFAKNGTNGHQMDQIMGKTECSAKNQNFGFLKWPNIETFSPVLWNGKTCLCFVANLH